MSAAKILMLFDNMNRDYVARLSSGAERQARLSGGAVETVNLYGSDRSLAQVIDETGPAGVILTAPPSDDRHMMLELERRSLPFARIAAMLDPGRGINVTMDEYEAARSITEKLALAGHTKIGIIRGPRTHLSSMRRYNGFTAALGAKGVKLEPSMVVEGEYDRASGAEVGDKLIASGVTAVFASNDAMAAGFIDAARRAGKRVPQDISVIGFDDDPIARNMTPQLTSVRQPLEDMGAKAYELLLAAIGGAGSATASAEISFEIVERASVASPPG